MTAMREPKVREDGYCAPLWIPAFAGMTARQIASVKSKILKCASGAGRGSANSFVFVLQIITHGGQRFGIFALGENVEDTDQLRVICGIEFANPFIGYLFARQLSSKVALFTGVVTQIVQFSFTCVRVQNKFFAKF